MINGPLVSVCVATYNHESFIKQTLSGILSQKTNFDFEIIIGEDCSIDQTASLISEYKNKFPSIINVITSERNVGHIENYCRIYKAARGKYIAVCDGDDYWTNDEKLQMQVDFLEGNLSYSACAHNSIIINENDQKKGLYCHFKGDMKFNLSGFIKENMIPTSSVVFRNHINDEFLNRLRKVVVDDWILHIYNAEFGDYYYMDKVMAQYRVHSGGMWAGLTPLQRSVFKINSILDINAAFDFRYDKEFREVLFEMYKNKPVGVKDMLRYYRKKYF
jgi:glycosyltransferase involved in cell wall biosynthesis